MKNKNNIYHNNYAVEYTEDEERFEFLKPYIQELMDNIKTNPFPLLKIRESQFGNILIGDWDIEYGWSTGMDFLGHTGFGYILEFSWGGSYDTDIWLIYDGTNKDEDECFQELVYLSENNLLK